MKEIKHHSALLFASLAVLAAIALFVMPGIRHRTRGQQGILSNFAIPGVAQASEINPWKAAIEKVKQDRGEPTGKQAKVDIPSEVKHYSDTRRFLAIQVAESRQHSLRTPTDLVDLADMVKRGEMVTLQPVTDNYILFGVGGSANKNPLPVMRKARASRFLTRRVYSWNIKGSVGCLKYGAVSSPVLKQNSQASKA